MSNMEYWSGVAKRLDTGGRTVEEFARDYFEGADLPSWCEDYTEWLLDEHYQEFMVADGFLWSISAESFDPDNLSDIDYIGQDAIQFKVSFYNGGANLREVLSGWLA